MKKTHRFTSPFPFLLIPILDKFFRDHLAKVDRGRRQPSLLSGTLTVETAIGGGTLIKFDGRTAGRFDSKPEKISLSGVLHSGFHGDSPIGVWRVVWGTDTYDFSFS